MRASWTRWHQPRPLRLVTSRDQWAVPASKKEWWQELPHAACPGEGEQSLEEKDDGLLEMLANEVHHDHESRGGIQHTIVYIRGINLPVPTTIVLVPTLRRGGTRDEKQRRYESRVLAMHLPRPTGEQILVP